ncbi:hypothetical protein AaE_006265 [Aphanomyces astaci]|uniref:Uncharacterized protein n=1 Tax=Aphanomyces astaci TaxID=112090 RepID=A0A6A5A0J9_APHAT|nr:hypothetical protein AaE_006265 [Aphanomyces astaci]
MDNPTVSRSTAEDVAAAPVDRMGSLDKALEDSGNDALRGPKAVAAVQVLPEGYLPLATRLGLALPDATTSSLLQIESFDVLKAKVRQLALHSGFQVKLDGRSDKRRQWKCTSHRSCPFSIVGNRNRYGIFVKPHLPHNHAFHVHEAMNKRFTTGTTHEVTILILNDPHASSYVARVHSAAIGALCQPRPVSHFWDTDRQLHLRRHGVPHQPNACEPHQAHAAGGPRWVCVPWRRHPRLPPGVVVLVVLARDSTCFQSRRKQQPDHTG